MNKLIVLKGLQASGKSTFAKQYVAKHPGTIRLNNDDMRIQFHDGKWSKSNEKDISRARQILTETFLLEGRTVIWDNLNLHPKHEAMARELAKTYVAEVEIKDFPIDVEEAIKRDLRRPNSVGERVIRDTYERYLKPKREVYEPPLNKLPAIICDVDGTLAHVVTDRDIYDESRAGEDAVDGAIAELVRIFDGEGYKIIIVSGRQDSAKKVTAEWLDENDVPYDEIHMRKVGDKRKDSIVKREIFDEHIRDNYRIEYVIDDRPQVARMWYSLGLTLLKVGDPDLDF